MNANLQKYLKYKSKYLDLKNELMGGKNYAELNGGGLKEIQEIEEKLKLLEIRLEQNSTKEGYDKISEEISNLNKKKRELEAEGYRSEGYRPLGFSDAAEASSAAERTATKRRSPSANQTFTSAVRTNDIEGMTRSRTLPTSRSSAPLPRSNAFGVVGQFDDAPEALRGEPSKQSLFTRIGRALSPSKADSSNRADSPSRAAQRLSLDTHLDTHLDSLIRQGSRQGSSQAASSVKRHSPGEPQRSQLKAPETRLRNDSANRTASTIRRGSPSEQQTLQGSQHQLRERRQELFDDNEPGAAGPRIKSEDERLVEEFQKNLINKAKARNSLNQMSNETQLVGQIEKLSIGVLNNLEQIIEEMRGNDAYETTKSANSTVLQNNIMIYYINRLGKANLNSDNFYNMIKELKISHKNNKVLIAHLNMYNNY
jgi:hypothetical protein